MDGSALSGLSWIKTADSISDFLKRSGSKPPRRAVFCTYDFDNDRFLQILGPLLNGRRPFRSWVLVDRGSLQKNVKSTGSIDRLQIAPIRCLHGGIFHPKLILLQAGSHYFAGVGSANLTNGGFGENLELMLFADTAQEKGRALVQGAAWFLDRLTKSSAIIMSEDVKAFIHDLLSGIEPNQGPVLDSLEEPLLDQMKKRLSDFATERIAVLSPWHTATENEEGVNPEVIAEIREGLAKQVCVYTQGRRGKPPNLGKTVEVKIRSDQPNKLGFSQELNQAIETDNEAEDAFQRRPNSVHAKAYLAADAGRNGVLFVGSANCTVPALLRKVYGDGGNVEILVAIQLKRFQTAKFFNDLEDLFIKTFEPPFDVHSNRRVSTQRGKILWGKLLERGGSIIGLLLEAPEVSNGTIVQIASSPSGPWVKVMIESAKGLVTDASDLKRLLALEIDKGRFFFELIGKMSVPFPVCFPFHASSGDDAVDSLMAFVEDELGKVGIWRDRAKPNTELTGKEKTTDLEDRKIEKELRRLAEAKHQGRLDQIAVAISVLKRSILKHPGHRYARLRFQTITQKLKPLISNEAIARLIEEHLGVNNREAL
jgi:hypothetical protein